MGSERNFAELWNRTALDAAKSSAGVLRMSSDNDVQRNMRPRSDVKLPALLVALGCRSCPTETAPIPRHDVGAVEPRLSKQLLL